MVEVKAIADTYMYKLYNLSGQLLIGGKSDSPDFSVHVGDDISDGLYYLEVTIEDNGSVSHSSYKKLVIQK